ncbi:alpha/beta hydrolase [Flavobacteriaceae bacterium D16]|nr:alpha/beta hydrolase [Flavobacteriaceae bacterium D16]
MKAFKRILFLGLGAYLITIVMFYFFQEKLIFLSTPLPQNYAYSFSEYFEEIFLTADDGARLNALWFKKEDPKGLVLYFHGNADNLSRWGEITIPFVRKGYDVLVMDYRTYGKSTGKLSEKALFSDAQLFYDFAAENYEENQIVLYGRSLGTGLATKLAAQNKPAQLLLETPYYSLLDIGVKRFPWLPVKWFMKYPLRTYEFVQEISCPVRVFHGTEDKVVPYNSGLKLFDTIPLRNKVFHTIKGGGHNDLISYPDFREALELSLLSDQSNSAEER